MSEITAAPPLSMELDRMAQEFDAQRQKLNRNSIEFRHWQNSWQDRQKSIDASLESLRLRLEQCQKAVEGQPAASLRLHR